jgi:two-component system aerobic respiration control sensor histidine kinase ArcB
MEGQTVLVVGHDGEELAELGSVSRGTSSAVSVRSCPELGSLYDELCLTPVDCLVLPAEVSGTRAVDVARGVDAFYPDLPVVVVGLSPGAVPKDLDVVAVEAADMGADSVAEAVGVALADGSDTHAARPPSRMETLLLSMFDQFPMHLYAKDSETRHAMVSRHANEPTDLVGITDLEYEELPKAHREAAYRDDRRVVDDEERLLEVEEYTDYVDSHTLTTKVPWYHGDEVVGLVGVTRDITERKQREHAARRQQELLVKLAILSAHEFRNELQVALGRLELVDEDPSQIEVIEESHEHLVEIVDKVIELASRERRTHEYRQVWLSTLAREVWDSLPTTDATHSVAGDARLVADLESLSLFLQILFDNALEHVGPGVRVTVGTTGDGFFVADDGPGIEDQSDRVFDAGYTTVEGNTGFGLFVARSIAHEHNWSVSVSTSEAGGLRFDVVGPDIVDELD